MHGVVDSRLIEDIWRGVKQPCLRTRPKLINDLVTKFLRDGVAEIYDVQDLIWAMEPRFPDLQIGDLARSLGINVQPMFPRSRTRHRSVVGTMWMSTAGVASLLIDLERLGFQVDPSIVTEPLLKSLTKAPRLDRSELSVVWFDKERHKLAPLTLVVDPRDIGRRLEEVRTDNGYRIQLSRNEVGQATMLVSFAPKYRARSAA